MRKFLFRLFLMMAFCQGSIVLADSIETKVEQHGTAKYLEIISIHSKVTDRLLTVHLQIKNKDSGDNRGYYRASWLDESGDPVWDEEVWKPLLLHGNEKKNIKMVAPTTKAKDYKIEFSAEENYRE
jgi:uncharacterized protein YcfL